MRNYAVSFYFQKLRQVKGDEVADTIVELVQSLPSRRYGPLTVGDRD